MKFKNPPWNSTFSCELGCILHIPPHHNRFTALFSGTTRVSWCQKRTYGLYGARED